MEGSSYTIRLKRGDAEFELSGSQQDVQKAWAALEDAVVGTFKSEWAGKATGESGRASGAGDTKRKAKKRSGGSYTDSVEESDAKAKLMGAPIDDFPEIDENTPALIAGFATLSWARDTLDLQELTVPEIHGFLRDNLRIPHTGAAYRNAFTRKPRAVQGSKDRPKRYRLMKPGDTALATYLRSVAAGETAAQAGAEAEAEADE